ncbi:MFS transporter [Pedobacter frigiditerrae]|uniref:MFS transporter n=1 Tax=Pedobacter frigiditerrae TaxID=2530452 RepID=A0A4R0MTP2_9SPHI|nr:MFS transporter [Pedobacter frigiditerrae]TCC90459.1 MFS transporter [Pedobacter frigiditerrae]
MNPSNKRNVTLIIIVAALGYFVDIYDLVLFSVVRIESLTEIGVSTANLKNDGIFIINCQMFGLLLGGLLWGTLGDKMGRVKVLFGSILLYSLANIANGFVMSVNSYALIRFIAGIGLAGELGAGITLVAETMDKEKRGYGTMIVAGVGLLGAAAATTVHEAYSWKTSYFVGGGMGLLLLLLRLGTFESGMFKQIAGQEKVSKGNFFMLFKSKERFLKYLYCILIGIPLWFVVGVLVTLCKEFGEELGATETLDAGRGIMFTYFGIAIGDVFTGFLSQMLKSRRKTVFIFHILSAISVVLYLTSKGLSSDSFIWLCLFMGFSVGYWATFVTIAAEQFGTNIRATVTTTAPNFVRGALIPINFLFVYLAQKFTNITAAFIVMGILTIVALFALSQLKETFNKDLDYVEV